MTRADAIKKLLKRLGKHAYWRIGEKQSYADRREAARTDATYWRQIKDTASKALSARAALLCQQDAEYQRLKDECAAARAALLKANEVAWYWRFEVGTSDPSPIGNILHQKAKGDTWEEVFAELDKQKGGQS